jgi:hypothetical protein
LILATESPTPLSSDELDSCNSATTFSVCRSASQGKKVTSALSTNLDRADFVLSGQNDNDLNDDEGETRAEPGRSTTAVLDNQLTPSLMGFATPFPVGVAAPSVVIVQDETSSSEALEVLKASELRRIGELKAAIEDVKPPPGAPLDLSPAELQRLINAAAQGVQAGAGQTAGGAAK